MKLNDFSSSSNFSSVIGKLERKDIDDSISYENIYPSNNPSALENILDSISGFNEIPYFTKLVMLKEINPYKMYKCLIKNNISVQNIIIATAQGEHFNIKCSPMTINKVSSAIDNIF